MISINAKGQMGNQLFQIAAMISLSKRHKTAFLFKAYDNIDRLSYFNFSSTKINYIQKFSFLMYKMQFRISQYPMRLLEKVFVLPKKRQFDEDWWTQNTDESNMPDNCLYNAFFQSEDYFFSHKDIVKDILSVKERYIRAFLFQYPFVLQRKTIVIHLRRTDYKNTAWFDLAEDGDLTLPVAYYEKAMMQINDIEKYQMIFVSDDIAFAKENFAHYKDAFFVNDSEINDFLLIMHADIAIIANSSFSWWAAYLNRKSHKKIIAPSEWIGFKIGKRYPVKIIPKEWDCILF